MIDRTFMSIQFKTPLTIQSGEHLKIEFEHCVPMKVIKIDLDGTEHIAPFNIIPEPMVFEHQPWIVDAMDNPNVK